MAPYFIALMLLLQYHDICNPKKTVLTSCIKDMRQENGKQVTQPEMDKKKDFSQNDIKVTRK